MVTRIVLITAIGALLGGCAVAESREENCNASGAFAGSGGGDRDGGTIGDASLVDVRRVDSDQTLCPNGAAPTDADLPDCPPTIPEAGSCCPVVGMVCFYPGSNETYRDVARCFDDSLHAPYWQQTVALDRLLCDRKTDALELGAGALACEERGTKECNACNCAPSDSVCAMRCGSSSGLVTPQEQLNGDLDDLIRSCGGLPNESTIQVIFTDGCATALAASLPGPPGTYDALRECIEQALDEVHFECADSLECAEVVYSTLP